MTTKTYSVYRQTYFPSGEWSRVLLGSITVAQTGDDYADFDKVRAFAMSFGPQFDGTSNNNTMLGDLRIFDEADGPVALSGKLGRQLMDKRRNQLFYR